MINVLIIHYNTQELTEAAIRSLWKHTPDAHVTVFDNSDKRPFERGSKFFTLLPSGQAQAEHSSLFTYIDNTQGQIVNWDEWLAQFPDKMQNSKNNWGSAKHCYSVEKCFDMFPDGFVLMDSDVLVKKDISDIIDISAAWCGDVHCNTKMFGVSVKRIVPFLCWINTPLLMQYGIRYFNPKKMWMLNGTSPDCYYDTGAWLLEACDNAGISGKRMRMGEHIEHYGGGSWRKHAPEDFLSRNRHLWMPEQQQQQQQMLDGGKAKYTVLTYIFGNYEMVHEVQERDPMADYILVTDNPNLRSDTWHIVVEEMSGMDAIEKMYDVRYHPFRYAKTELCVRLDGAIGINRPLMPFIEEVERGGYDRCLMIHPRRNKLPDEYGAWIRRRDYPQAHADHILSQMSQAGYDLQRRGLFQSCFEVVRNNAINNDINEKTFRLLRDFALDGHTDRIDQTLLSFVINHYYADRLKVLPVSESIVTDRNMMTWYRHNSLSFNNSRQTIEPVMFNKPCQVWR